jgi:hypothetical protein
MAEFRLGRLKFVWKGAWTGTTSYIKDDVVRYGGKSFVCTTTHTSAADFYDDLSSKWDLMSDGIQWRGSWLASTNYNTGDLVKDGGKSYICVTPHESLSTFEADSADWDLFTDGLRWRGDWDTTTLYELADIVRFGGSTYICIDAHTSAADYFDEAKWDIYTAGFQFESNWDEAVEYQIGDVVLYGGYTYIAVSRNTAGIPSVDSPIWETFVQGINSRGTWTTLTGGDTYKTGDIVLYGGNQYKCTAETTENPENVSYWELFNAGLSWRGTWSASSVKYKIGELVKEGTSTYICISHHTSSSGNSPTADISNTYWNAFADGSAEGVLTTRGDTIFRDAVGTARKPIGDPGDIYVVNAAGTEPEWSTTADITVNSISITTGAITTALGNISTDDGDISTLDGNITTGGGNISTTAGDISTTLGNIYTTAGDIYTSEGDISTTVGNVSVSGDGANGKITSTNHITVDALGANDGSLYVGKDAEVQTVDAGGYTGFTDAAGVFTRDVDAYAQVALKNLNAGEAASSDWIAYADNGDTNSGWIDMGITSSVFNDATYGITGPNDGYIFMSAPEGTTGNGNLYISTNNTGLQNDIVFSTNGFGRISSEKMRLIGVSHDGLQPGLEIDVEVETQIDHTGGYNTTATVITVLSTAEFPETGTLIIGSEEITYTGKTAITFTGLTRGAHGTTAATIANNAVVASVTESVSPTTGALRVNGGIGLTGALNAEGDIVAAGGAIYQGESSTGVTAKHLTQDDSLFTGYVGLTDTSGVFTGDANAFVQFALKNHNSGDSASTDIIAYASNGDNDSGWIDMGITSGSYDDPDFTVTGPDTGYLFMSAPAGTTSTGNLLIGTSDTGVENDIIVFSNGFDGGNERLRIVGAARPGHALGVEVLAPTESTSTTTGALRVNGGMGLIGNLNVGGNVDIVGTITVGGAGSSLETTTLAVSDPMIIMGNGNTTSDSIDLGFYGLYGSSGTKYAGLVRDASDNTFKLFSALSTTPTTTVDFTGATYAPLRIGALTATSGTFSTTLAVTGDTTLTGDLAVNGGDITSTATTVNVLNSSVTTLNIGGAATALALGASSGITTVNNALSFGQTQEKLATKTGATGTVTHDWTSGAIFFHSSIAANFTANFTNMPTDANKAYAMTLLLSQGGTGYIPNAVQVNGSAVTLRWANNVTPTAGTNKIEMVAFSLWYTGGTWYCTGQYTAFA